MTELLETPLTVLHVLACLFLILVILVQPGKSGGLGAFGGGGATQVFGGRGAGNLLTRTTWTTAGIFFMTSLTLAYLNSSIGDSLEDAAKKKDQVELGPIEPNAGPSKPDSAPKP